MREILAQLREHPQQGLLNTHGDVRKLFIMLLNFFCGLDEVVFSLVGCSY